MKIISVLLSFLLIINSLELVLGGANDSAAEVLLKCQIEVGASEEDVKAINKKKMPTTHTGFCLMSCIYENAGIIQDGKFVVENLSKVIEGGNTSVGGKMAKKFINEVHTDCKDVHNDDKCYLSRDIIICAAESIARHASLMKEL